MSISSLIDEKKKFQHHTNTDLGLFSPKVESLNEFVDRQYMLYQENYESRGLTDLMAGRVPLEVGTRGTIGSLVKREIDYFRKLEVERIENRMNIERNSEEKAPGGRHSWPSFKFSMASWRRKKRRNSGIRPGICSMVEVADSERLKEIHGFSYLNLRVDSERYDV